MRIHKRGLPIVSVDDWFQVAPPKGKEKQWKDYRSAKELARYWTAQPIDDVLQPILRLLAPLGNVSLESAEPECSCKIDSLPGESPNCDLVVQGSSSSGKICLHIEAKADETFNELVLKRSAKSKANSGLPVRIDMLSRELFGRPVDEMINSLYYQLLYGTYATYLNCIRMGATAGIFMIHEFQSAHTAQVKTDRNAKAWKRFLRVFPELTDVDCLDNVLLGPVKLASQGSPDVRVPIYFAKHTTKLS